MATTLKQQIFHRRRRRRWEGSANEVKSDFVREWCLEQGLTWRAGRLPTERCSWKVLKHMKDDMLQRKKTDD